jgi:hypothetical protein
MRRFTEDQPPGFDIFWNQWKQTARHTDGRGKCRDQYAKQLKLGATPEDLILAAAYHVRNTKDLAFIPLASSWLTAEKWRDEADKEREYQLRLAARAENVVQMKRVSNYKSKFLQQYEKMKEG